MVDDLRKKGAPVWHEYLEASERAESQARVLRDSGDYPLLGGGDVNLYSLFVERAETLVAKDGLVALLTPSGIAADKGAAEFFRGISGTGRLAALLDFENRKVFFPDIHASFKFCALVFGGEARRFETAKCAFFLHALTELDDPERMLALSSDDFTRVNPNTGAAPIFRSKRDAELTTRIYANHPVLVNRSTGTEKKVWPVRYVRMFDMTNDSDKFLTRAELEKRGWKPAPLNRLAKGKAEAVPLYEGKMVQMYDHRAADVVVNAQNLHRAAQQEAIKASEKIAPDRYPAPQFWATASDVDAIWPGGWSLAFKSITAPTNMRTMLTSFVPKSGVGNSMAILLPEGSVAGGNSFLPLLLANMSVHAFDFVLRQKVQGQNLNWFIVEQLPVIAPAAFEQRIGKTKIADYIRAEVLALTYTAHDMAPLARDLGYVDGNGRVKPPFVWDPEDRRQRMARLDALFMRLYGLGEADADYILSTFPIVREKDAAAFGTYRTRDLILAYLQRIEKGLLSHAGM